MCPVQGQENDLILLVPHGSWFFPDTELHLGIKMIVGVLPLPIAFRYEYKASERFI